MNNVANKQINDVSSFEVGFGYKILFSFFNKIFQFYCFDEYADCRIYLSKQYCSDCWYMMAETEAEDEVSNENVPRPD